MNIPFELVSMGMVLREYTEDIPYINEEHERLVDFVDFLRKNDDPDEVKGLIEVGYDPSDLIAKYDEKFFIDAVSGALAIEAYLDQEDGDINEIYADYVKDVEHRQFDPRKGLEDILLANTRIGGKGKNTVFADTEIDLDEFNSVTFDSVEELYNTIDGGQDLYCPETKTYMFAYNEAGAVCFYTLSELEFYDLVEEAFEVGEDYISGLLGIGGGIVDVNLIAPDGEIIDYDDPRFDEFAYTDGYEIDYTDVYKALKRFVGVGMILANVRDFNFDNPYQPGTVGDYLFTYYNDIEWVETFYADGSKGWSCRPGNILHDSSNDKWINAKIIREEPGDISWVKNSVRLYTDLVK